MHSQRVSETSLKIWLTISANGEVLHCHCNCVAGLGEACTHVAAILFALEYAGKQEKSVTDTLAYWIGPKSKKAFYKKIVDISFEMPQTVLSSADEEMFDVPMDAVPELSDAEIESFLTAYRSEGASCVLHSFFEEPVSSNWPCLTDLFKEELQNKTISELKAIGDALSTVVTQEEATKIEEITRNQSKNKLWYKLRAGRITASNFHAVCATSIAKPSQSLLKRICYPHVYKAVFKAGIYGCEHEKDALQAFEDIHSKKHECSLSRCGLILNINYPWCAATPDAILNCNECGTCCVEVKCPYCAKDTSVSDLLEKGKGCLVKTDEKVMLSRKHAYYYQVQMQMALSNFHTCYFIVWSKKDVFVEKIEFSEAFWNDKIKDAELFHKNVVLPELLGKYFTHGKQAADMEQPLTSKTAELRVESKTEVINV